MASSRSILFAVLGFVCIVGGIFAPSQFALGLYALAVTLLVAALNGLRLDAIEGKLDKLLKDHSS